MDYDFTANVEESLDEIAQGNSVIMLIPEISLTPQFTSFFSDLFERVGVVHSGLTPKKNSVLAGMKASFVVAVGLAPITK